MSVSHRLSTFRPSLTTHQKRKVATSKAHLRSVLGQLALDSSRHEPDPVAKGSKYDQIRLHCPQGEQEKDFVSDLYAIQK